MVRANPLVSPNTYLSPEFPLQNSENWSPRTRLNSFASGEPQMAGRCWSLACRRLRHVCSHHLAGWWPCLTVQLRHHMSAGWLHVTCWLQRHVIGWWRCHVTGWWRCHVIGWWRCHGFGWWRCHGIGWWRRLQNGDETKHQRGKTAGDHSRTVSDARPLWNTEKKMNRQSLSYDNYGRPFAPHE